MVKLNVVEHFLKIIGNLIATRKPTITLLLTPSGAATAPPPVATQNPQICLTPPLTQAFR